MVQECVEYVSEKIKLLKVLIAILKLEEQVRFAEVELQTSCAVDPIMIPFWSWREPTLKEALRLRHEEHRLQAEVVKNMGEQLILYEEGEGERGREREREGERERARREEETRKKREKKRSRPSSNGVIPARPSMNRSW